MCQKDKKTHFLKKAEEKVGKKYGELTVKKVIGMRSYGGASQTFVLCECSCGKEVEAPLSHVAAGQWSSCGHVRKSSLSSISQRSHAEGTYIYAIDGRSKTPSTSSTGVKGVSRHRNGYRAYITFKKKQYFLGCYLTIEEAAAARKAAEKEIYGSFLDWYSESHPEEWKKMKKKEKIHEI